MQEQDATPRVRGLSPLPHARVVAEIGCNHKGSFEIAREMITTAKIFCKVDCVKFQKRTPRELLSEVEFNTPHPESYHSYGRTYGAHREALEFDLDTHRQLKELCEELGMSYSCSVWDRTSTREIAMLAPPFIKVPSASNTNEWMLGYLCDHFGGEIHISLGMTTRAEEEFIVQYMVSKGRSKDLVLYSCTSGYPIAAEDVCLLEIQRLKDTYGSIIRSIGFSGHHLGIAIDIAAYVLGATWIERHFTLDRTWKGTDHAASLEPDGLRRLARDLNAVNRAMSFKHSELLEVELLQRNKLKWNRSTADWVAQSKNVAS